MKEEILGIVTRMASQELSEEKAMTSIASLKFDVAVWEQLVRELPAYASEPVTALHLTNLLYRWAQCQNEEVYQQQGILWKGWGALLNSEFATANDCFDNAREYFQKNKPHGLYSCYLLYADGYSTVGRFSKALEYYQETLKLAEHQDVDARIYVFCKMAQMERRFGKLQEAIAHYQNALQLSISKNEEQLILQIARALCEIFPIAEKAEDKKLERFEETLRFFAEKGMRTVQAVITAEMAKVIVAHGYKEKAVECLEQALSLVEGLPPFREKSDILTQLGKLYQEQGEFLKAIGSFEKSREILRDIGGKKATQTHSVYPFPESPQESDGLETPPATPETQRQPESMAEESEKDIDSYKKMLVQARNEHDVARECSLLHTMGNVYVGLGELEEAMQCWHESLALAQQQQNMEALYQNYFRLGLISLKRCDLDGARNSFLHGIEILELMRDYMPAFSPKFIEEHAEIFHHMISCCVGMGNMASALHFLEHMHRWMFLGYIQESILVRRAAVDEALKDKYQQELEKLQVIYQDICQQESQKLSETAVRNSWKTVRSYQEKLEEMRIHIEVLDPDWEGWFGRQLRFDPGELQSMLGEGTVLLEFLPGSEETLIFIVDAQQIEVIFIKELDSKKLAKLCEPLCNITEYIHLWQDCQIESRVGSSETQKTSLDKLKKFPWKNLFDAQHAWKSHIETMCWELSEIILSRLLPILEDADRLVLIPCHSFALLPLHLLTLPGSDQKIHLQDRFEITYAPSARLFMECQRRQPNQAAHLLTVGYPGKNLRFFEHELDRIGRIWGKKATSALYEKANPENICEPMKKASHIHFGTHTVSHFPVPVNSILYMADVEPGKVFQLRVPHVMAKFYFNAPVVTIASSDREFHFARVGKCGGFSEAFLYCGARTVIESMWVVPDIVAFLLMDIFYHGLKQGLPSGMALYEAQREIRKMTLEEVHKRLSLQYKLLPTTKSLWLKEICSLIKGEDLPPDQKKSVLEMWSVLRDSTTADIAGNNMELKHFVPEPEKVDFSNLKSCPFEHPYYWGGFICSGMGLTPQTAKKEDPEDGLSVSVFIEDLGFMQDGDTTAKDIQQVLSALTDEGLQTCESPTKAVQENPVLKEEIEAAKAKNQHYLRARCPNCNKKIRCIVLSDAGGTSRCPQCGKKIRIPPRPSPFDDIKISALCPKCGQNIHCFLTMAGKRAECSRCHHKVRIPKREILLAEIASRDLNSRIILLDN